MLLIYIQFILPLKSKLLLLPAVFPAAPCTAFFVWFSFSFSCSCSCSCSHSCSHSCSFLFSFSFSRSRFLVHVLVFSFSFSCSHSRFLVLILVFSFSFSCSCFLIVFVHKLTLWLVDHHFIVLLIFLLSLPLQCGLFTKYCCLLLFRSISASANSIPIPIPIPLLGFRSYASAGGVFSTLCTHPAFKFKLSYSAARKLL